MPIFPPTYSAYTASARPAAGARTREPGTPDTRSPMRFMLWLFSQQKALIAANAILSLIFYAPGALMPFFTGKAVDEGILANNMGATIMWALAMVAVMIAGVIADILGHTSAVAGWLVAMYRVTGLVARKVTQMGHVQTRRVPTGEMLSVASSDADTFGAVAEVIGRAIASIFAFLGVAFLVLTQSVQLGLVVLIASPFLVMSATPLLRPLYAAQSRERERSSELTGMATDIVAGLRILRGIGGEQTFGDNYANQSQKVRRAGVLAGTWFGAVQATSTLFSGLLLLSLTWLGARELLAGRLTVGQLVSFFGYMVFLVRPLEMFFQTAQKWTHGLVAARKTIGVLEQEPVWLAQAKPAEWAGGRIVDEASGFVAEPGELTIIVSAVPDDSAALADRIGRYLPVAPPPAALADDEDVKGRAAKKARADKIAQRRELAAADEALAADHWGVSIGGVDLSDLDLDEVRRRVLVSDAAASVFAGTLQQLIDPLGVHTREQAEWALNAASGDDVWEALPEGWQGRLDERGRGLSGGQRQRLVLARALLADPEILVLVEPTSAVDAHTESRIAQRVPAHRMGQTTIVTTVSPLWLHHADRVALMVDGKVTAVGRHTDLLATNDAYRAVVSRGGDA